MKNWERAEAKIARGIGGKRSPGSGNGSIEGDVKNKILCVECKETSKEFMVLHINWFVKIVDESTRNNRIPVLAVEFGNGTQIYFIREKDYTEEINVTYDWTNRSTIRIYPNDLLTFRKVATNYGSWIIVDMEYLKDLSKE